MKGFIFKPCYTRMPKITAVKSLRHQKPDRVHDKKRSIYDTPVIVLISLCYSGYLEHI